MEKLELKHLAPYLPYELKLIKPNHDNEIIVMNRLMKINKALYINDNYVHVGNYLAILHPLSDLTKEIEHNGERFVPIVKISEMRSRFLHESEFDIAVGRLKMDISTKRLAYDMYQKLFEWHFDVFNLIDKNLAIDINTL